MKSFSHVSLALLALLVTSHAVPVYVMLPLTVINNNRVLNDRFKLQSNLDYLSREAHIDGVMVDVWWGLVERDGPKQYYWQPYLDLVDVVRSANLTLKVIMSFHKCGGNVGDSCDIKLPQWVRDAAPKAFYTDKQGTVDYEYVSLGADQQRIFQGRSPLEIYGDYMQSFSDEVLSKSRDVIKQVEVSLGPAGELRYPSYKQGTYPGVGEFQTYDPFMLAMLNQSAVAAGHPEWGHGGPSNAGTYHNQPSQTGFWSGGSNNFASAYGRFFLKWYSQALIDHADRVLGVASQVFASQGVEIAGKVSGIHWQYKTVQHAAECTGGYYNTNGNNAYTGIAQVFKKHGASLCFTCLEMFDSDQCASCGPQELVKQVRGAASQVGVPFEGENALPIYDSRHYNQIAYQSRTPNDAADFTYLRLSDTMLNQYNFPAFQSFVSQMHSE